MLLIDPPAWPAHGRLWSHLVSDTSLAELHAAAAALGVPRRGFDLDHYDVPGERYGDVLDFGALAVDGRTLARRLAGSGLRVAGRDRPPLKALRRRWLGLIPAVGPGGGGPRGDGPGGDGGRVGSADGLDIADDLLVRWREPHRVYHDVAHLTATLDAADVLDPVGEALPRYALWFHDAVHRGVAGDDERESAQLAADLLGPHLPAADVAEVVRLVLTTIDHDPADPYAALVSDADLAVLGAPPDAYAEYARQIRREYAHVPDDAFRVGRADVLRGLLAPEFIYATEAGRVRWEVQARANLNAELTAL